MNFDRYDELRKALSQCPSEDNDNLIDPADVYRVCAGVGLPLKNDLLTALIQKSVGFFDEFDDASMHMRRLFGQVLGSQKCITLIPFVQFSEFQSRMVVLITNHSWKN